MLLKLNLKIAMKNIPASQNKYSSRNTTDEFQSFFYLLRDDGSWLEIGLSISHYVVSISMSVSIFLMLTLATFFVNFSLSSQSLSPIRQLFAGSKTDELL